MKFDERPFIAIWETTQACDLACRHCRASATPARDLGELDTAEGMRLLDALAAARVPLVVLTGGDPAKRPDLVALVSHGVSRGLGMALTPSATPLVTSELIHALASAGLSRLAISIDAPDSETHDAFRGVPGSFERSLVILRDANAAGIRTQINTSLHSGNIHALRRMTSIVEQSGSVLWSVFFVVPTGRAGVQLLPSASEVEAALDQLAGIAASARFSVKTTAAPHYRRVLLQRKKAGAAHVSAGTHGAPALRVNDGRGFLFVSHRGEIFPSGFLPIGCGNVRSDDVMEVYRKHPTFVELRDPDGLHGKCGACEYRSVCGGSRARAYALTGDRRASDPLCAYVPAGFDGAPEIWDGTRRRRALPMLQSGGS
ncbi:MAG TPA: TIGR04053 family radical SAM/SPASM domain-containing protein [Polyangiaceae bacterium]|nr:TIGR04053 family radical SAM/SPASM domain-containing protein [Polyangiaceae bacterium]